MRITKYSEGRELRRHGAEGRHTDREKEKEGGGIKESGGRRGKKKIKWRQKQRKSVCEREREKKEIEGGTQHERESM